MISWLIWLGQSNNPSISVWAKVECSKSCDYFGCQVMNCSAIRILSTSITSHHSQPTASFSWEVLSLCRGPVCVLFNPSHIGQIHCKNYSIISLIRIGKKLGVYKYQWIIKKYIEDSGVSQGIWYGKVQGNYTVEILLSFLLRCGTRPYERGTQWDSNSLV